MKYTALRDWIKFKMKMAPGYNYQPVMIITLLQNNGKATREKIEQELKKNNHHNLPWKKTEYPFKILLEHKVCKYNESDKTYELLDFETFPDDNSQWQAVLVTKCRERMGEAKSFSKIESKSYMLLTHKSKSKWHDELGKRYHYNIKTVHYSKDIKPGTKTIWFYRKAKKYHFWGYGEVSSILDKDKDITDKNERIATFDNFTFFNENKSPIITSSLIDEKSNGKMKNIRDPLIVIDQEIHDEIINFKSKDIPRVVLFSVAGSAAYHHYEECIMNNVSTLDFTNSEMKQFDKVRAWGAMDRPKNNNRSKWSKLKKGDILLFYKDKQYISSLVLQGTEDNEEIARKMWGEKFDHDEMNIESQSGETWQLILYGLPEGFHECEVDFEKFNELCDYKDNFMPTRTLDFSPIRKDKLDALAEKFGSVQKALESIGFNFGTMLSAEIEDLIVRFDGNKNFFKPDRKSEQELQDLINEFRSKFPPERIPSFTLDEYVPGKPLADGKVNKETFCWWLEHGTRNLGRLGIYGATEFGVYWNKEENAYLKLDIFEEQNITTIDGAFTAIKNEISSIINAGSEYQKDHDKEKLIKVMDVDHKDRFLTTGIHSKILYLYFSQEFLSLYSFSTMIKPVMQIFGFPENEIENKNITMQFKLLNLKNSHPIMSKWRNEDYSHFLWEVKKRLLDNKDEDADDDIEEEILLENTKLPIPTKDQLESGIKEIQEELLIPESKIIQIVQALASGRHVLLSGPIGTGKTQLARKIPKIIWNYYADLHTATADWTTQDVIGGIMPKMGDNNQPVYDIHNGCVVDTVLKNWSRGEGEKGRVTFGDYKGVWAIIDEFNRADIDKAFGQLFTSLRTKEMQIPTNKVGKSYEDLKIPDDYRIIGTLNTADKHFLFKLSDALKSRFAYIEVGIPPREKKDEEIYYAMKNALGNLEQKFDFISLDDKNKKISNDTSSEFKEIIKTAYNCIDLVRHYKKLGTAILMLIFQNLLVGTEMKQDPNSVLDSALSTNIISQLENLQIPEIESIEAILTGTIPKFVDQKQKDVDSESYTPSIKKILEYLQLEGIDKIVRNFSNQKITEEQFEKIKSNNEKLVKNTELTEFLQGLDDLKN